MFLYSGKNLISAACYGNHKCLQIILKKKEININHHDITGLSPLLISIQRNALKSVQILLQDTRIDVNSPDSRNRTPLHYAAKGFYSIAKLLLSHQQIKKKVLDNRGRSPLDISLQLAQMDIVTLFIDNGVGK